MTMASSLRLYLDIQFETFTVYDRQSMTILEEADTSHGSRPNYNFPSRHLNAIPMKNYLVGLY
jgi:hypothetical protein